MVAGYDKAFGTIFDSNLTTLISSIILIYMGTGPVKGFGVTLTIGVAVSMFTALVVTRLFFEWLLDRNLLKSLTMLQLVHATKIDFLNFAKPAFAISWAMIVVGCGYGLYRGADVLGVEFRGGDSMTLAFSEKVEVDRLRSSLEKAGLREAAIQYQSDLSTGKENLRVVVPFEQGTNVLGALAKDFPAAKFGQIGLDQVGPTVGREIQRAAIVASLLAMFGILIYVAMRYEFSFAVGAVLAIVHDILMTMGWFCISGRQFQRPDGGRRLDDHRFLDQRHDRDLRPHSRGPQTRGARDVPGSDEQGAQSDPEPDDHYLGHRIPGHHVALPLWRRGNQRFRVPPSWWAS